MRLIAILILSLAIVTACHHRDQASMQAAHAIKTMEAEQ